MTSDLKSGGLRTRTLPSELECIGNMVQSNSVADALRSSFGVDPFWTGIVIAALSALVILGGIRSIGRFTGFFVPVMIVFYILGALVVLVINWRGIPSIFAYVLADAFRPVAAGGPERLFTSGLVLHG